MKFFKIVRYLWKLKNAQIKKERERYMALASENQILSAYLAVLIEEKGDVRIPRETVSEMIGSFSARAEICGDDYVISLIREKRSVKGNGSD